jgi:PncC family amidohydrolase
VTEVVRTYPAGSGERVVPIENLVVDELIARGWRVAVAESLTAGAVAARLCWVPGTDDRVLGGVVAYTDGAKRRVLGTTVDDVVSAEAAAEMAGTVRDLFGADVGLSLTGVAGPDRQEGQPVGTVFVGWSTPAEAGHIELACAGTPEQIRHEAANRAMTALLAALGGGADGVR